MGNLGKTFYASTEPVQYNTQKIDYSEINARLLQMLPNLLSEWLPAGRKEGREYVCGDLQGNSGNSLKVNLNTGKWGDFATTDKGGDLVSLFAAINGIGQIDAAKELGKKYGLLDFPSQRPKQRIVTDPPSFNHPKHGNPSQVWTYHDSGGDVLHYIARYDQADGKKQFNPFRPDGTRKYAEGLRPLYGLNRLAARPSAPVIICEGEKAADAAQRLCPDFVVITWSGGSNATGNADWTPLQGRTVTVWPDADEAGTMAAKAVETALSGIAASIRMVDVSNRPNKWDAADAEADGLIKTDVAALLEIPVRATSDWLTRAKVFSSQPSPISWQIKHWIQDKALIMVHGPSGGGKTFIVLDWMLSIASDRPDWFGHKVRGGRVIYLAGEGHHGLKGRIAVWRQEHGVDDPNLFLSSSGCNLNTPEGYQRVAENLHALDAPPTAIVVDTLHRFLEGDENSAKDAKTMLDACAAIMEEFGCTVILVHHTGVADDAQHRARGSSAWRGALDIEVSVIPPKGNNGSIEILQRKSKDDELAESVFVDLKSVPIDGWADDDGEPVTSAVLEEGVKPVKPKASTPQQKQMKLFERAWWHSGSEVMGDKPYVTKSGFKAFLESLDFSASAVKNYSKPSYPNGTVGLLQGVQIISPTDEGWVIEDNVWASALMVQKGS